MSGTTIQKAEQQSEWNTDVRVVTPRAYILLVNHGPGYDIKLHPGGWYRYAIHPGT